VKTLRQFLESLVDAVPADHPSRKYHAGPRYKLKTRVIQYAIAKRPGLARIGARAYFGVARATGKKTYAHH
jgi:hypothetical protein